ncbi:MAG: hypothetical protein H6Q55_466 [Deltaproteobacteria bacterium]|nr:hypothetical protein [Deltaproteobacteria bacterium]
MGQKDPPQAHVQRRNTKRVPANATSAAHVVVPVCMDRLKKINLWYSAKTGQGSALFVTESGKEIWRTLVQTCLSPGTWELVISQKKERNADITNPVNVDKDLYDATVKKSKQGIPTLETRGGGQEPVDQVLHCLFLSSRGFSVPVYVSWSADDAGGTGGQGIPKTHLSDDYLHELGRQDLAIIYLALLEHFAGIAIPDSVAVGGISRDEYKEITAKTSKCPALDPQTIARILTQGFHEIQIIKKPANEHLVMMVSTILRQRKLKNPLALANQLEIGKGDLRLLGGKYEKDYGLRERGRKGFLLYDKWGEPVPLYLGVADKYYRTIDLSKIQVVPVTDRFASDMMATLQQVFVYDNVQAVQGVVAMVEFCRYISAEVYRQFQVAQVEEYVRKMLPATLIFFAVHALGGFLAKRGSPLGVALLVAAKAAGFVMSIDYKLMWYKIMIEAGGHFAKLEEIHRTAPGEKEKTELTKLSRYHLTLGCSALLQGIYTAVAMKVFVVGGKLGGAAGKSIAKFIAKTRTQAALELIVDKDGNIESIKAIRGGQTVEIPVDPVGTKIGEVGKTPSTEITTPAGKTVRVKDRSPLSAGDGRTGGLPERTTVPKARDLVPILEYLFKPMAEKPGTPAMEARTGIPNETLDLVIKTATAEGNVVLLRVGKAASIPYARLGGYSYKGKKLMFVNADPATGFVTVKGTDTARMAMDNGYYVLGRDGRCYNSEATWGMPEHALKINGETVQFKIDWQGGKATGSNRPGQVIDPATGRQILPDIDVQDVIRPNAQTVNAASIPLYRGEDVVSAPMRSFMSRFNAEARKADVAAGRPQADRILHGADAQFWQRIYFRNQAFKGDAIVVLPDGRVRFLAEAELPSFYQKIGREILSIFSRKYQLPHEPGKPRRAPAAAPAGAAH